MISGPNARLSSEACDAIPGFQPTLTSGKSNFSQICECMRSTSLSASDIDGVFPSQSLLDTGRIKMPLLSLTRGRTL